jgi:hypothetical protein
MSILKTQQEAKNQDPINGPYLVGQYWGAETLLKEIIYEQRRKIKKSS